MMKRFLTSIWQQLQTYCGDMLGYLEPACKSQMIISVEIVASCSQEQENKGVERQNQIIVAQGKKNKTKKHSNYVSKANILCVLHQNIICESRATTGA